MRTMEQVKEDFKTLPKSEQWGLLEKLQDELEEGLELTDEFKSEIEQAKQDIAEGRGRTVTPE